MESNYITLILLPLALGIIMLGLGISLSIADFKRVIVYPKAIFIGLFCQMIVLPILCFFLAKLFNLSPELAAGLMLLSASPGGPTANLFSFLAKGDVALNISLTAANSLLSLFTLPFIINYSFVYFMGSDQTIPMQFKKIIEVFVIVLVPVAIGMYLKSKNPSLTSKLEKPIKVVSALFLVAIILVALMKEKDNVVSFFLQVGTVTLVFNVLSMAIGFYIPRLFQLAKKQSISIGMEIGIHNGTMAIYIALSVIGNSAMSIPPAIYSLIMFFTAAAFGYIVNIGRKPELES
jgi:BASS family bile acid:Na+ symporter